MPKQTYTAEQVADWLRIRANQIGAERYRQRTQSGIVMRTDPDEALRDAADAFMASPPAPGVHLGPNVGRPEHGAANLADARAYHERLAARGERDES